MTGKKNTKIWFTQNVEENMDALYGVALRLTGKPADAEDLTAEAVTKAWCALDSLETGLTSGPGCSGYSGICS